MEPGRWQRLSALFNRAIERPADERPAFLEEACPDDPDLRRDVLSLLARHDEEGPAPAGASTDAPADRPDPVIGRQIGPYLVQERIGYGGMGVVYLAQDTRLGRRVALKAVAPELAGHAQLRGRLRREAQLAAALSDPGIATVFALEEVDGNLFIVCEYIEGRTLRAVIGEGPLEPAAAIGIGRQIARALAAAHARGIVHRDLKPENIMQTPSGAIKVLDFGLARLHAFETAAGIDEQLTAPGIVMGTPGYMSPEQRRAEPVDFATDIYAFGVVLHELLTGRRPGESADGPQGEPDSTPDLPRPLRSIVARCTRQRRDQRYASAVELLHDLDAAAAALQAPAVTAGGRRSSPTASLVQAGGIRSAGAATPVRRRGLSPLWWWRAHQMLVSLVYLFMLYPAWLVRHRIDRDGPASGPVLFYILLGVVILGTSLRLHLAFASRFYPRELAVQRSRTAGWVRAADIGFSALLLALAWLLDARWGLWAAILAGVGLVTVVVAVWIEPATTRAAFGRRLSSPRSGEG